MRILVFSDTHLTTSFDQKRFDFLKQIITEADTVVINGDFWDGYIISFDSFVNSDWSGLFPLLKSKKSTYIYGNHDRGEMTDNRVSLFSTDQSDKIFIKSHKNEFVIEHGNKYLKYIDEAVPQQMIPRLFAQTALDYERFIIRSFGTSLIKYLYKEGNETIKQKSISKLSENQILVCGHTHLQEIDLKNKFVNSGLINYGLGQYILIENDEIIEKEFWYDTPQIEEMLDPKLYKNYSIDIKLKSK